MKVVKYFFFCFVFFLLMDQTSGQNSAETSAFFKDVVDELTFIGGRVVSLAESMPADKYSWRPMEGVRSVSEVYMHIVGGNYFILSFVGGTLPEGMKPDYDKSVTDKDQIVNLLKESYQSAKDFVSGMNEADLDKEVDFFGNKMNYRKILFLIMNHSHEHLGQSIAYARSNGVTPPWSANDN